MPDSSKRYPPLAKAKPIKWQWMCVCDNRYKEKKCKCWWQPVEEVTLEQVDVPKGSCDPWEYHAMYHTMQGRGTYTIEGLLARFVTPWQICTEAAYSWRAGGRNNRNIWYSPPALEGVKVNPERREGWGKGLFKIWISLLITLLWFDWWLINFSQLCLFCPWQWLVSDLSLPLSCYFLFSALPS